MFAGIHASPAVKACAIRKFKPAHAFSFYDSYDTSSVFPESPALVGQ